MTKIRKIVSKPREVIDDITKNIDKTFNKENNVPEFLIKQKDKLIAKITAPLKRLFDMAIESVNSVLRLVDEGFNAA